MLKPLYGFLSDGLVIIGVSEYWQMIFKGAVIVLAVLLNAVDYKKRRKSRVSTTPPTSSATLPSASAEPTAEKTVR